MKWPTERRAVLLATAAILAVLGAGVVVALSLRAQHDQSNRNATALTALCAQRHDLDQRIEQTKVLLKRRPGKFVFGIPRGLIVASYKRDQTTRRNLSILDCKETP